MIEKAFRKVYQMTIPYFYCDGPYNELHRIVSLLVSSLLWGKLDHQFLFSHYSLERETAGQVVLRQTSRNQRWLYYNSSISERPGRLINLQMNVH